MQAIITKFLPVTNHKPNRIKASCARGSIIISVDSCKEDCHLEAAKKLIAKFLANDAAACVHVPSYDESRNSWAKPFNSGQLPSGDYAHVFNESANLEKQIVANVCDVAEILSSKAKHQMGIHVQQVIGTARQAFGIKTN